MSFRTLPVSRCELEIAPDQAPEAITEAVKWLARRCGARLPAEAFEGAPFETGLDAHGPAVAHRVAIDGTDYWGAKLRFPDRDVASRTWLTEIVVRSGAEAALSVRLAVKDTVDGFKARPTVRSVPGVVRQFTAELIINDGGMPVGGELMMIETLAEFEARVLASARLLPILLFGAAAYEEHADSIADLAGSLAGVCHVGVLHADASWEVSKRFSRQFSVFGPYARLYYHIPNAAYFSPFDHPLYDLAKSPDLKTVVIGDCLNLRTTSGPSLPSMADLAAAERASAADAQSYDSIELQRLNELNAELEEDAKSFNDLMADEAEKARAAKSENDRLQQEVDALHEKLANLSEIFGAVSGGPRPNNRPPLRSFELVEQWCGVVGAGALVVTKPFLKSVEDAFKILPEDETYLYRVAEALDGIAAVSCGEIAMRGKNIAIGSGVEISPVGDIAGHQQHYQFLHRGDTFVSDWHAKWGNGYDLRSMFRIYYCWDTANRRAILQCFGLHLRNKSTN